MREQLYIAMHPINDEQYLLACINKASSIIFKDFAWGTLEQLAARYRCSYLAVAIEDKYLSTQTHYFPSNTTDLDIYKSLKCSAEFLDTSFDFQELSIEENTEERFVMSFALSDQKILSRYREFGFSLSAVEPLSTVQSRVLNKNWQEIGLEQFQTKFAQNAEEYAAKICLQLLDRENFYVTSY